MKLVLVALALAAAPSALAMAPYVPSTEYVEFAGDCVDGNGEFTFNANYQYENPSTPHRPARVLGRMRTASLGAIR